MQCEHVLDWTWNKNNQFLYLRFSAQSGCSSESSLYSFSSSTQTCLTSGEGTLTWSQALRSCESHNTHLYSVTESQQVNLPAKDFWVGNSLHQSGLSCYVYWFQNHKWVGWQTLRFPYCKCSCAKSLIWTIGISAWTLSLSICDRIDLLTLSYDYFYLPRVYMWSMGGMLSRWWALFVLG